jgi:magnesium chelatase family protein
VGPTQVRDYCQVDETGRQLLGAAMRQMNLSARAYHRELKLARTIADLAGPERIQPAYIAEAIHLRWAAVDGVAYGCHIHATA